MFTKSPKILIVDDEKSIILGLKNALRDYDVTAFTDSKEAIDSIKKGSKYDLLLVDFRMPSMGGKDLLQEVKKYLVSYKAILITAYSEDELVDLGYKESLFDLIIPKPFYKEDVQEKVNELLTKLKKERTITDFGICKNKVHVPLGDKDLIYKSEVMHKVVETANKYAQYNDTIYIAGESGVGKDIISRYIHLNSPRKNNRLVIVNCSTVSENLFESEFYGYKKGAFSGAITDKPGFFHQAHKGTLFLDEIGDLPLSHQVKLLRALEEKCITPVGGTKTEAVDVRFVCATNKNLKELVKKGEFREDLMYRINGFCIEIPPLRERREDIPVLAEHFIVEFAKQNNSIAKELNYEAVRYLSSLNLPGNVRELANIIRNVCTLEDSSYILTSKMINNVIENSIHGNDLRQEEILQLKDCLKNYNVSLKYIEELYLKAQLEKHNYNVSSTARILGVDQGNLSRRIKNLGISCKDYKKKV